MSPGILLSLKSPRCYIICQSLRNPAGLLDFWRYGCPCILYDMGDLPQWLPYWWLRPYEWEIAENVYLSWHQFILCFSFFDLSEPLSVHLVRRNFVFVSSTIKHCIVLELALSTTAGTARTWGCMSTYSKDYPQLVSPIYERRTSGHPSGLWSEHSETVNGRMLSWECWVLGLLAQFWP